MNFQQYINQENPRQMPAGSVEVQESDCESVTKYTNGTTRITLKMFGNFFEYIVPKGCQTMYTVTSDGNPKTRSVFKFKPNE